MPRRRDYEDDSEAEEEYGEEEEESEEEEEGGRGYSASGKKRSREEEEDYGSRRGGRRKKPSLSQFLDTEAAVDSDEEDEDEDEAEDGFFVGPEADLGEEEGNRSERRPFIPEEHEVEEDVDEIERQVKEHFSYSRSNQMDYAEDATDVEQQANLPSVKDPKLWLVKCKIGKERQMAKILMQKYRQRKDLQILSVIALDHLKNCFYVEAYKEAHVKEACNGLIDIYSTKIMLVPIKEMTCVLSAQNKSFDLTIDTWVRMKIGVYKGDLAKVVDVDNVNQKVIVKLIPRIDLQMIANKQEGFVMPKNKAIKIPQRFFNVEEAMNMRIRVEKRNGELDKLRFKDGFLYKTVSIRSINSHEIKPSLDELDKFQKGDHQNLNISILRTTKKGNFLRGDSVIVVRGNLKNLEGFIEKVNEDGTVDVKPKDQSLSMLGFYEEELCKNFKIGNHVKVEYGEKNGITGIVVNVKGRVLTIHSDVTRQEQITVFADDVVQSSGIMTNVTQIGDYKLHDLVLLEGSFGMILQVEDGAFQVLKGVPDRSEIIIVKLGEIKSKIYRRSNAKDKFNNQISFKDIVTVFDGPLMGKKGSVEHIYNGIVFIRENSGFICTKARSCMLPGGFNTSIRYNSNEMNAFDSRYSALRNPLIRPPTHSGNGNGLVGKYVRIKSGPYKSCLGRITKLDGVSNYSTVHVELEFQMRIITVKRDQIIEAPPKYNPFKEQRYSLGGETPIHPSRTPLHHMQTPMRYPSAIFYIHLFRPF